MPSLHVIVFRNQWEMHIEQIFIALTKSAQLWVMKFHCWQEEHYWRNPPQVNLLPNNKWPTMDLMPTSGTQSVATHEKIQVFFLAVGNVGLPRRNILAMQVLGTILLGAVWQERVSCMKHFQVLLFKYYSQPGFAMVLRSSQFNPPFTAMLRVQWALFDSST